MKKYFILGIIFMFCISAIAQRPDTKTVKNTSSFGFNGVAANGDTVIKNSTVYYNYYTPSLFSTAQFQVLTDTVTGKPKTRLYIYQSFDASNWVYADSATTITGGGVGRTTKTTIYAPYTQLRVKGVDSTQKTVVLKVIANLTIY